MAGTEHGTSDARFRFRNRNQFRNHSVFGWNLNQENQVGLESERNRSGIREFFVESESESEF